MERIKRFFRSEATVAFVLYSAFYAVLAAFVWWGAWPLDRSMVQPDHAMVFPPDKAAQFMRGVLEGGSFVPFDIHWFLGSPFWWAELEYAVPCWLAGLAVCFYLRGRGLGRLAGYGAGLGFAFSGYLLTLFSAGHMGWFEFISYGIFAFGLTDRAVKGGEWRSWALLGAVLAWGAARQQDMWMIFTALAAFYGMWCIVREWRTGGLVARGGVGARGTAAHLAAGLALCALVTAAAGTPMFVDAVTQSLAGRIEQINDVSKATGVDMEDPAAAAAAQWEFATNWSMPPEDMLEFVAAGVRGDSSDPRVSPSRPYWGRLGRPVDEKFVAGKVMPNYRQHSLYLGAITVVLALFGVFGWFCGGRPKDSDVPFWLAATVVCTLLAMGRYTPFYRLVYSLPVMSFLRAPVKFHHLTELCVAVLAGYGIAVVTAGAGQQERARKWGMAAGCALAGVLAVVAVALMADSTAISQGISKLGIVRAPDMGAALASNMASSVAAGCVVCAAASVALWYAARRSARLALAVAALAVAANAVMLAVNDRRYCSPLDISFPRARNDAAAEVVSRGGGKVVDLLQGALTDSMIVNGADKITGDPNDRSARFAIAPVVQEQDGKGRMLAGYLRSRRATQVGGYVATRSGVRKAQGAKAQFSLYEFGDWTKEAEKPRKTSVLSIVSVLTTLGMLGWALKYPKSSH